MDKPIVITLGESMVLFQTMQDGPLQYAPALSKTMAGAEGNVSIGLTRLGINTRWISRLGQDPFGDYIQSTLKGEDVDVHVIRDKHKPTGVMFKEIKGEMDPNAFYYRKDSAASNWHLSDLTPEQFSEAKLFHFTGITPALSQAAKEITFKAVHLAKQAGLTISFDPNMRYKLWSVEEARETFIELIKHSDIVLPGLEEGKLITNESDPYLIAKEIIKMGPKTVVIKLGENGSTLYTLNAENKIDTINEPGFLVKKVIDSVGAGDGFAAGFLSAYLEQKSFSECLQRANAVGAMVTQYRGDWEGIPTKEETNQFIHGDKVTTR